jgi:plasmid stabilization system protein ParE
MRMPAVCRRTPKSNAECRVVPELGRDDIREVLKRTYRIVYRVRGDRVEVLTISEGHRLFPPDIEGT